MTRYNSLHRSLTWPETLQARYTKATPPLLFTAFSAVGVIYGDIGTSPLYVINGIFSADGPAPSSEDVLGAISAIIWALTIVPLIKYSLIALEFGTGEGEGGPFALFSQMYPIEKAGSELALPSIDLIDHVATGATPFLARRFVKPFLRVVTLFAVALIISDGILTPAVSVSSAVSGIAIPVPTLQSNAITGISIGILVLIFFSQQFGTHKLGMSFAPIVTIWLLLLSGIGIYNISKHPAIFRAFDPTRAILYFVRVKDLRPLSGILLSITGVEALFANLGQFSKGAIRLSFIAWIYPALVLAYLGQGSQLIINGDNVISNVFYQSIPGATGGGLWWLVWIFGLLATIVASQAMITASFSLIQQMVGLKAFPPVAIVHTSDTSQGQIYAPIVNFLLLIGTVGVTAGFGTDSSLTSAYGFAVAGVLITTTFLMMMVMIHVKNINIAVAVTFFVITGFVDAAFFASTLQKVPHGAWFTLSLGCLIGLFLLFWSWAKELEDNFDSQKRVRLGYLLLHDTAHSPANSSKNSSVKSRASFSEHEIPNQVFPEETPKDEDAEGRPEIKPDPSDKYGARPISLNGVLSLDEKPDKLDLNEGGSNFPEIDRKPPPHDDVTTSILLDTRLASAQNNASETSIPFPHRGRERSSSGTFKITIAEPDGRRCSVNQTTQHHRVQFNDKQSEMPPVAVSPEKNGSGISTIQPFAQRQGSRISLPTETGSPSLRLNPRFLDDTIITGSLPRLECFSFFHHLGQGVGAPHSFTSLLKHQPSLPRVIIFFSIRVVGVPHLQEEDKYLIDKLRAFDGFYVMTLRLGYRDPVDLRGLTEPTLERIVSLERGLTPVGQNPVLDSHVLRLVKASENANHIVPHYHCTSKRDRVPRGPVDRALHAIRAFLLEDVYRRVSLNFSETSNFIVDESKVLRIGVNAQI